MNTSTHTIVSAKLGRPITLDITLPDESSHPLPLLIFAHGFKGFKDWGTWPLVARWFAQKGYAFLKFNFSHNGTSPAHPTEFVDLEAFGHNTFSREQADVRAVLDWALDPSRHPSWTADPQRLVLIGHSRGGALSITAAGCDPRIRYLVTWASVNRLDYLWRGQPDLLKHWKKEGVYSIRNGRTGQDMPMYYSIVEDFQGQKEAFDTEAILKNLSIPLLVLHGEDDPAIPPAHARDLKVWAGKQAKLQLISGGDHVFGGRHPYPTDRLPDKTLELLEHTAHWLDQKLVLTG